MWALLVGTGTGRAVGSLLNRYVKVHRQFLGWIARVVVTCLIFEFAVDGIFAGQNVGLRDDHSLDGQIS
jgi:hypothetical protein